MGECHTKGCAQSAVADFDGFPLCLHHVMEWLVNAHARLNLLDRHTVPDLRAALQRAEQERDEAVAAWTGACRQARIDVIRESSRADNAEAALAVAVEALEWCRTTRPHMESVDRALARIRELTEPK